MTPKTITWLVIAGVILIAIRKQLFEFIKNVFKKNKQTKG